MKHSAALCRGAAEEQAGESVVYVGVDGRGVVGRLGFRDALRPDSADVVRRLQDMSIRVALLSGDNAAAVRAIAVQAGIQVRTCSRSCLALASGFHAAALSRRWQSAWCCLLGMLAFGAKPVNGEEAHLRDNCTSILSAQITGTIGQSDLKALSSLEEPSDACRER